MNPNPENLEKSKSNDNTMNVQSKNSNSKDDFDILDISFEDIINKNETENLNDLITCPICLNLLISPLQCNKCNKCFCKGCINDYEKKDNYVCPFKCENPEYNPNKFVNNVLSILKFKCKNGCDKIIKYDELEKHYQEDCDKIDFKAKYKVLLKKYKELKKLAEDNDLSLDDLNPDGNQINSDNQMDNFQDDIGPNQNQFIPHNELYPNTHGIPFYPPPNQFNPNFAPYPNSYVPRFPAPRQNEYGPNPNQYPF